MGFGGTQQQRSCWEYRVPPGVPPGRYELTVQLTARIDDNSMGGGIGSTFTSSAKPNARLITLKTMVDVAPSDLPPHPPVELSPGAETALKNQLANVSVYGHAPVLRTERRSARSASLQVTFDLQDMPAAMAHRVFVVASGKEHELGTLVSGTAAASQGTGYWNLGMNESTRTIHAAIDRLDLKQTKTIDIVLRPDPSLTRSMLDPVAVYGGEVVLRNIPVGTDSQRFFYQASDADSPFEEATADDLVPDAEPPK
jgi:hypothetical protein